MFFNLSYVPQVNFPCYYTLGNLCVSTDAGWSYRELQDYQILFKGYADDFCIESDVNLLITQTEPKNLGNFCAFVYDKRQQAVKIKTDRYRSFPIYVEQGNFVSNLAQSQHVAWTDSLLTIMPDLSVHEEKFDVIGTIDVSQIDVHEALDIIQKRLLQRTTQWLSHNQKPIRSFLSGGVDSLLVYSLLLSCGAQPELISFSHIDHDYFWLKNSGTLRSQYWAYNQIHHWYEPCVLTSGAPGDEFMLRSPTTIGMFLQYRGLNIQDLLQDAKWQKCLHNSYFNKSTHQRLFQSQQVDCDQPPEQFYRSLCNVVINDWQHWHLGRTLTWTPLRDLEIFKTLLRVGNDDIIPQILDSAISKHMISEAGPSLIAAISDQKNTNNYMSNLCDLLNQHPVQ